MTRRRYDRYDAEAEVAQPSVVDLDVHVPCGLAIRLGVGSGLLMALLWAALMPKENVAWWVVLVRPGIIGAAIGMAVYLLLFGLWARDERRDRKQQRAPQQQTRLEVDGTPPRFERRVIPVRLDIQAGGQHRLLDVDITPELQVFARRVLAWRKDALAPLGLSFAEVPAKSVEFDGFLPFRDEMMARGLLRWKNTEHHLSGYDFRAGFDEALRYVAAYEMEG